MSTHGPILPGESGEPGESVEQAETGGSARAGRPPADRPGATRLVEFTVDLSSHEMLRRTHTVAALGAGWDPMAALHGEQEAYDLLYSGLDAEQQRLYEELIAAGVLPRRGGGDAAA
ncbi:MULTISPECIES: DUF6400 family protein [unclassified Streptomyces]|uniref:DUF6400 family protein n=1 Tax=unclassified Streptomyces TaxID=2593676 RepID=UPI00341C53CC